MTSVNTYLTFDGNCEKAFNFYKEAFQVDFSFISRFSDIPENAQMEISDEQAQKIMHVTLPIGNTPLMGSDTGGEWSKNHQVGTNFSVSINTDSKEEADRLFYALSSGGNVSMPMKNTFWNSYFGMFVDKFGIQWMISFDANAK